MFKGGIPVVHKPSGARGWITGEKFLTTKDGFVVRTNVRFLDEATVLNRIHGEGRTGYFSTVESQKYRLRKLNIGGEWYSVAGCFDDDLERPVGPYHKEVDK